MYDNYYEDRRVRAQNRWYTEFDEKKMVATVTLYNEEDHSESDEDIPVLFEVCPTCNGKGKHVNPSIDCNGLTAEDFAEDPDFAESYISGMYDVPCYGCDGRRVVPVVDEERTPRDLLAKLHQKWQDEADYRATVMAERRFGC